ncbi:MAG: M1 family metallopeptidase [Pseudomonadales bacterium]|nr:M1 family metallopeptidase [Pseudomonadales bacterium]MCP5343012.1 M1 family metallopeptidase [Pseudomonadales bacterium]
MSRRSVAIALFITTLSPAGAFSDTVKQTKDDFEDKFRQLDEALPTPNTWRNAGGQPGHEYWQQQVDYKISAVLDEANRRLSGSETISYLNNSPDTLSYLWLQLDQNIFRTDSMAEMSEDFGGAGRRGPAVQVGGSDTPARLSLDELRRQQAMADVEMGYQINAVEDTRGNALPYTIVGTLMRIDLPSALRSGQSTEFNIDFAFNIVEEDAVSARSGYEHFPDDEREGGNDIFLLAQWYPRLAAYTDYEGWTNKEFLGRGEFTLEFGNYEVEMTVPADHIVSSTGTLQNPNQVLSNTQRERLREAEDAQRPVFIVTAEEALENEKEGTEDTRTWRFKAENVRDFAWASSRKFIWDAKGYDQGGDVRPFVMAQSFYPKEGEPLWSTYSTEAIIHTLEVYSRVSFDYPYPTAQSVNGPVGGMEYPMITFNGPRTNLQDDGSRTYSLATKQGLIGVVIHEVGHSYFPMIINSDERQWTWMDEGLNSYMDGVAGREWDPDIPWGVEPADITSYMRSQNQVPIMTQSDSVLNLGPNAYSKPAVALNILRETVMGRELFDFAFKQYTNLWMFKRPTPADFFRTMEEASGVDLDWFWRGWFYSTDHVDISLDRVYEMRLDTENPDIDNDRRRREWEDKPDSLFVTRNAQEGMRTWVERNPDVRDFHDEHDMFTVTNKERNRYNEFMKGLEDWERQALERAIAEDKNYYVLEFSNLGGLVMPIILGVTYADDSGEEIRIPAEIWRRDAHMVRKLIVTEKDIKDIVVDPHWETADVDIENNYYPRRLIPSRVEAYKNERRDSFSARDLMQDYKSELKSEDDEDEDEDEDEQ